MTEPSRPTLADQIARIQLVALDVDGVLTDGVVEVTDGQTPETKRFHVADGLGIQLLLHAGLLVAWISGRRSTAVAARAAELGVAHLSQGVRNKAQVLAELMAEHSLTQDQVAFMGDDLNDLPAFSLAGLKAAPANAINEIKALADLVTERSGGDGAVREFCDVVLKVQGRWNDAVSSYLAAQLRQE